MNASDPGANERATPFATVDFPDPEPPAMPMINGERKRGVAELRTGGPEFGKGFMVENSPAILPARHGGR